MEALTTLIILFIIISLAFDWRQGHTGFWGNVVDIYSIGNSHKPILNFHGVGPCFCYFRIDKDEWSSWNNFVIRFTEDGIKIHSWVFNYIYPAVFIPLRNIQVLREEKIKILTMIVVKVDNCPGEFALPAKCEKYFR